MRLPPLKPAKAKSKRVRVSAAASDAGAGADAAAKAARRPSRARTVRRSSASRSPPRKARPRKAKSEDDESEEQPSFARGDNQANGERRPRRRGRRGGRRRRGGEREDGLAGSISDELAPPQASEAADAVADFDSGPSQEPFAAGSAARADRPGVRSAAGPSGLRRSRCMHSPNRSPRRATSRCAAPPCAKRSASGPAAPRSAETPAPAPLDSRSPRHRPSPHPRRRATVSRARPAGGHAVSAAARKPI